MLAGGRWCFSRRHDNNNDNNDDDDDDSWRVASRRMTVVIYTTSSAARRSSRSLSVHAGGNYRPRTRIHRLHAPPIALETLRDCRRCRRRCDGCRHGGHCRRRPPSSAGSTLNRCRSAGARWVPIIGERTSACLWRRCYCCCWIWCRRRMLIKVRAARVLASTDTNTLHTFDQRYA